MGSHTSKSSGGDGGSGSQPYKGNTVSNLEIAREISRQYVDAQKKALKKNAYILEYTDINGNKLTRYRQGTRYVSQRQTMYESMFPSKSQTVYKDKFKRPSDWGIIRTDKKTGEMIVQRKKKQE